MIFTPLPLSGAYIIDIEPIMDKRGFFSRTYCTEAFKETGLDFSIVQTNISYNYHKGTLRGLHYQQAPYEETKLVSCIQGAVFDVLVDLRKDAQTYMKWMGVRLTADNHRMLYIPKGFAHGYQTLKDNTLVQYALDMPYHPEAAAGALWCDEAFGIQWPETEHPILSDKDKAWERWKV